MKQRRRFERRPYQTLAQLAGYEPEEAEPVAVQPEPVAVNTATPEKVLEVNTATTPKPIQPQLRPVAVRKPDRHDANRERVNFWMDTQQKQEMKEFAARYGMDLTDFFIQAAVRFMEGVAVRTAAGVAVNTSHDDLMIWKTADDIIMLYARLTGNRWKPADDKVGRAYNEADRRLVEIGILNTLLNAKGKRINSFAYFIPEIDEAMAVRLSDETIEIMLPRRREQWAKRGKR